jgi:2-iminobutanoate/2-iminopropanoate deaminase
MKRSTLIQKALSPALLSAAILAGCNTSPASDPAAETPAVTIAAEVEAAAPEYFLLRPEVEKAYGYTHAIKIGDDVKISGAVSMDDAGNPTAVGDLEQQMKNAYADLEKVLDHFGLTFDDVVVENVYTTDMARFLELSAYRNSIYTKNFPTGTWCEVKGLALPEFLIEIELEAHLPR